MAALQLRLCLCSLGAHGAAAVGLGPFGYWVGTIAVFTVAARGRLARGSASSSRSLSASVLTARIRPDA